MVLETSRGSRQHRFYCPLADKTIFRRRKRKTRSRTVLSPGLVPPLCGSSLNPPIGQPGVCIALMTLVALLGASGAGYRACTGLRSSNLAEADRLLSLADGDALRQPLHCMAKTLGDTLAERERRACPRPPCSDFGQEITPLEELGPDFHHDTWCIGPGNPLGKETSPQLEQRQTNSSTSTRTTGSHPGLEAVLLRQNWTRVRADLALPMRWLRKQYLGSRTPRHRPPRW